MKGRNEIRWNRATMAAAVQHYLDTVLLKDANVEVDDVYQYNGNSEPVFVVEMVEKVPPK